MKTRTIAYILLFSLFMNLSFSAFGEEANGKTDKTDEVPQGIQDFRRFEVISLGAMPFVTLDVTLGYSIIDYANQKAKGKTDLEFPNPFKASANGGYNDEEIKGIILTSLGISLAIGITDLVVRIIKRNRVQVKKNKSKLNILNIEDDPDAIKIETDLFNNNSTDFDDDGVIFLDEEQATDTVADTGLVPDTVTEENQ